MNKLCLIEFQFANYDGILSDCILFANFEGTLLSCSLKSKLCRSRSLSGCSLANYEVGVVQDCFWLANFEGDLTDCNLANPHSILASKQ